MGNVLLKSEGDLEKLSAELRKRKEGARHTVVVCGGTGCRAFRCEEVENAFKEELMKAGIKDSVELKMSGCHGFCEMGPLVLISPGDRFYVKVKAEDAGEIVQKTICQDQEIERLCYKDEKGLRYSGYFNVPFYGHQKRVVLGLNGQIDPTSIEDYICNDGYSALTRVLSGMSPEEVIEEVKTSGLRGRGGAGFLTGVKWGICRKSESKDGKCVICNGDEGDPGAYMDRSVLEGNPHSVLEGMIICSYAVGAGEGFIYVRAEYPLAVKHVEAAIARAEEYGILGNDIFGSGHSFRIKISQGAGAFVSGEETALIAAIEGMRSSPRPRPPYPTEKGYMGRPTNINNVETFANVPQIIRNGAAWYNSIGTEGSKGTKIFSLVGKINNTGLVEVPMGITLREIVFDIGGGIQKGKKFKAVQTGGPSGGCIPESMLDLHVDFDELTKAGSIMGSGGMIVMDEDSCMVDIARYFLEFTRSESCGKCTPCRMGSQHLLRMLTEISEGKASEGCLDKLERLAWTVQSGSLCGLGQTLPNPVLSALRYFRDEFEEHIRNRRCPAGVCKSLIRFYIDPKKCVGCLLCLKNCPANAISGELKKVHVIDDEKCIRCGACLDVCPPKVSAVIKFSGENPLHG